MIKINSEHGDITISNAVFTTITGAAATNCFGVKGMAYRSASLAVAMVPIFRVSAFFFSSSLVISVTAFWAAVA